MTYIVTKPFATLNRRFRVGDEIAATDIEGALTADDWADLGCLESAPEPMPTPVAGVDAGEKLE